MGKIRIAAIIAGLSLASTVRVPIPGQSPMDAGAAAKTRYQGQVAIWYGSHFEDTASHDWGPIKEWNGPFHPLLGEYKTSDPEIVRQHLRWLRRAGVDVIFYDVCRIQPELTLLELPKQKTLQLIVEELSHQEGETRKLQLALWLEKWNANPTAEQYRFGLEYIRERLAQNAFYFRLDGKPLVVTYLNGASSEIDALDREYAPFLTIRRLSPYPNVKGWRYFGPAGDAECMTVNPGADGFMEEAFIAKYVNKQTIDGEAYRRRGRAAVEQRAGGKTFEDQLLKARQVDPKIIFISGWNDWAWCLQIEPAKEYDFQYVDIAARLLGREAETRPYRDRALVRSGADAGPLKIYGDGRPAARYRLDAIDDGRVLRHGDGPGRCDALGAREAIVFAWKDDYFLHYDGAGPKGWLACLATSKDLRNWTKHGPVLDFGPQGQMDSASASSPWVYHDAGRWHMFYLGTPNTSPAPDLVPSFPYVTMKAQSRSPFGPWEKQYGVVPFMTKPGTYYATTASPGHVLRSGSGYLMFFSGSVLSRGIKRTLGIARTNDLDGAWTLDPEPIVPLEEQIENSSLYYEKADKTWWLFTNHIGIDKRGEYTDAVWVYWTHDLAKWDREQKAVVLDGRNCSWSKDGIGMPSVVQVGRRLAVFYDAPGGTSVSHMERDIGLAWLNLPLAPPEPGPGKELRQPFVGPDRLFD
jgi:hypothetical protein